MFALPYSAPKIEDVAFSLTFQVVPPGKKISNTITLKKVPAAGSSRFMVRHLSLNFLPKPFAPPFDAAKAERKGNVYIDAYKAFESIGLTAHVYAADMAKYAAVNDGYTTALASALFEQRRDVWPKATVMPRSLSAVSEKIKYARLFTEVGPPLAPVAKDLAPIGLEMTISGWGDSVHKAYMTSKVSADSKHAERVAYATYRPMPAAQADEEGVVVTKFFLVVKPPGGTDDDVAVISRVPWREDGSLYSSSPILRDSKGEDLWRKVGPQDITPGSEADVLLEDRTATASTVDGMVNKRVTIVELYFRRATPRPSTRPLDASGLSDSGFVLHEADIFSALDELCVVETAAAALDDLDAAGAAAVAASGAAAGGAASTDVALPAPTTPGAHPPIPSPPQIRGMFSAVSKPLDVDDDDEDEDSEGPAHAVFTQRGH